MNNEYLSYLRLKSKLEYKNEKINRLKLNALNQVSILNCEIFILNIYEMYKSKS